jgi:hypothetical protein
LCRLQDNNKKKCYFALFWHVDRCLGFFFFLRKKSCLYTKVNALVYALFHFNKISCCGGYWNLSSISLLLCFDYRF